MTPKFNKKNYKRNSKYDKQKKFAYIFQNHQKLNFFVIFCLGLGSNSKQQAPMKEVSFKTKCFIKIKRMKSLNESHRNFCNIKFYENSTGR